MLGAAASPPVSVPPVSGVSCPPVSAPPTSGVSGASGGSTAGCDTGVSGFFFDLISTGPSSASSFSLCCLIFFS